LLRHMARPSRQPRYFLAPRTTNRTQCCCWCVVRAGSGQPRLGSSRGQVGGQDRAFPSARARVHRHLLDDGDDDDDEQPLYSSPSFPFLLRSCRAVLCVSCVCPVACRVWPLSGFHRAFSFLSFNFPPRSVDIILFLGSAAGTWTRRQEGHLHPPRAARSTTPASSRTRWSPTRSGESGKRQTDERRGEKRERERRTTLRRRHQPIN